MPVPKQYSLLTAEQKTPLLLAWLEEHKARALTAFDVKNALTDVVIVATATSVRHAQSLADGLLAYCQEQNFEFLHMEGYTTGQWILVDMNDAIVHIFQEAVREQYNIESLFHDCPVLPVPSVTETSEK